MHFDEVTLHEYLDEPLAFPEREILESHLGVCAECRALLHELRVFEVALSAAWESPGGESEPSEAIRTLGDLVTWEDAEAETLLAPLLASPAAFRQANVTAMPSMRTTGVVRRLCTESRALRERQPMHALVLADAAIAIGEQLTVYPTPLLHELRGRGWFERANVLRCLGRYPEALDALDLAAHAFRRSPVPAFSNATVDYTRGVIFMETERLDEARRLARKSARVFRQFGEDERFLHAKIVEAGVLFHQHRYRDARELFLSLVAPAKSLGKAETLAQVYANVANCETELQELAAAEAYLSRALSLYEAIGLETGKIRTRWNLGSLRIAAGDVEEGLVQLRQARREFDEIGARTDAALVALDIVEALLSTGGRSAEAAELCTGLAESFAAVGLTGHASTALAFLRQAFESGRATPRLVRHVRQYIRTHPDQHDRPFHPPAGM